MILVFVNNITMVSKNGNSVQKWGLMQKLMQEPFTIKKIQISDLTKY